MRICVLGLDGAAPQLIFNDERLTNIRRLMELGVYGRLQSVVPPGDVPGWICLSASQDPGSLGVFGLRGRADHFYHSSCAVTSTAASGLTIWDHFGRYGKKSILLGVPPNYPPRQVNGVSVGCFLTPEVARAEFIYPANLKQQIIELVGEYAVDVRGTRKDLLRDELFEMSRKQWEVARWLLRERESDYFHFVDIGLNRVQHAFWRDFDQQGPADQPGSSYRNVIPDYYLWLDEQIGSVLELLDDDTALLLVSAHGAQRLDGGFAINQSLVNEGLLVLNDSPARVTAFDDLEIDWTRTKAWSTGGDYAPIFFNLQGREPSGSVPAADYEALQEDISGKLRRLHNAQEQVLNPTVYKPQELYKHVPPVAPDLIVHFDGLTCVASVGHPATCIGESDLSLHGCGNTVEGMFVLTAPNCPLAGEYAGAHLLDIAPTLLDLAGYAIPDSMQGRSLISGVEKSRDDGQSPEEQMILDRLAGLGYV